VGAKEGDGEAASREIETAAVGCPGGGARWREEEGVAARERTKKAAPSLWVCFYRARKGRGCFDRKQWPSMAKGAALLPSRGRGRLIEVTGGIEGGEVKERFHCALMVGLMEGRGGECGGTGRRCCTAKQGRGTGGGRWCRQEGPICQRVKERGREKLGRWTLGGPRS
jgi:hypothetical protein